jgi:pimeloyl-ACP methyl ester carboxylesterase
MTSTPSLEAPDPDARHGLSRRGLIGGAAAAAAAASLGSGLMQPAAASTRTSTASGSVSQPPSPPEGFTSRFINANGLRQHVVTGGDGPPLLLVHGWPQFWYAWRLVMPALAQHFSVIAVDQRGRGQTSKPAPGPSGTGYDTATLANDMAALMDALGHPSFSMAGHDTGMDIAYALAADHPGRIDRLAVAEAVLPGVTPTPPLLAFTQPQAERAFHFLFNKLSTMNVQLVHGREDIFFSFIFATDAFNQLPEFAVRVYIDELADSLASLSGSVGYYRASDATAAQNKQRMATKLTLPVLAIGGAEGLGSATAGTLELVADNVQTLVIPGCGHFVPEEAPEQLLAVLVPFLTA